MKEIVGKKTSLHYGITSYRRFSESDEEGDVGSESFSRDSIDSILKKSYMFEESTSLKVLLLPEGRFGY